MRAAESDRARAKRLGTTRHAQMARRRGAFWRTEPARDNDAARLRRVRQESAMDDTCYECREPAVSDTSCAFHLLLRRVRRRLANGRDPWKTPTRGRPPLVPDAELLDRLTQRQRQELRRAIGDPTT